MLKSSGTVAGATPASGHLPPRLLSNPQRPLASRGEPARLVVGGDAAGEGDPRRFVAELEHVPPMRPDARVVARHHLQTDPGIVHAPASFTRPPVNRRSAPSVLTSSQVNGPEARAATREAHLSRSLWSRDPLDHDLDRGAA